METKVNEVLSTGTGQKTIEISDKVPSWFHTREFFSKDHPVKERSPPSSHATVRTRELNTRPLKLFKSRARAVAGPLGPLRRRLGSIMSQSFHSTCSRTFVRRINKREVSPLESPSLSPQREMSEENTTRPAKLSNFKYWKEQGRIAPNSDVEESAEEAEKSPLKLTPHRQTLEERVAQSKAMLAQWDKEECPNLKKRPPRLEMAKEGEEGVQLVPQKQRKRKTRVAKEHSSGRTPAFRLWVEEFERRIAAGETQKRDDFISDRLPKTSGSDFELVYYGQKHGEEWDRLYGPNRDLVYAERILRDPNFLLESWQKTKDYRESLHTQQYWFLEGKRAKKLDDIKEKEKASQAKRRAKETLDQEAERLKKQRAINQRNRDQAKLNRDEPLKERLTPEEQKEARKKAKAECEKRRRLEKKAVGTPATSQEE